MAVLDGYEVFPDRIITTRLSLAVLLMDEYTEKPPIGLLKVSIKELNKKPVKNRSKYYLFCDIPGGYYTIFVESEYYFPVEKPVKVPDPPLPGQEYEPVIKDIKLEPKPSYPFPAGATLIRGMVIDMNNMPVSGANIEVTGKEVNSVTTEKGEFVLFFKGLKEEDLIDDKFVRRNDSKTVHLKATRDEKNGFSDLDEVEVGKTTILEESIILVVNNE